MPIKYIGRTTEFCGKTLWEIVGNLKNFGVGRLVYRQKFQRYDATEPCYFKILKVLPVQHDGNNSNPHENARKVIVYMETVFRGKKNPIVEEIYRTSYKADYRLVPKHEEHIWLKSTKEVEDKIDYIDPYIDMPPLLKKVVMRDLKAEKKSIKPDDLKLKLTFNEKTTNRKRTADENHPATIKIESFFGKPLSPQLYEMSDEVRKYFLEKKPF